MLCIESGFIVDSIYCSSNMNEILEINSIHEANLLKLNCDKSTRLSSTSVAEKSVLKVSEPFKEGVNL